MLLYILLTKLSSRVGGKQGKMTAKRKGNIDNDLEANKDQRNNLFDSESKEEAEEGFGCNAQQKKKKKGKSIALHTRSVYISH